MIDNIVVGNILESGNPKDIIIAMNVTFDDVLGIGRPFVDQIELTRKIGLGTVVTFDYDGKRMLHMLVCHNIGDGGWKDADKYVRYGLDYLWHTTRPRRHSIVNVGTGRVGLRDGADHVAIRSAIASSFLPVDLYVFDEREPATADVGARVTPMRPLKMGLMVKSDAICVRVEAK